MTDEVDELINKALKLHRAGNLIEAEQLYLDILGKKPNNGNALNLLGYLKIQNEQFNESIIYLEKALILYPDFFEAWFNLGLAYKNINELDTSIEAYKKALSFEPDNSVVCFNLANVFETKNETFKAIEYYEKALEYSKDKDDSGIHYFLGICYLKAKNFEKGLIHHEYRSSKYFTTHCQSLVYQDINTKPFWNGNPMKNKTLFVYYESALGDTIMYARYLDLVKDKFKKVLFKSQLPLIDFFKENNFGAEIIESRTLPENVIFDVHIPLMSIPYVLKLNTEEQIPLREGYLKANQEKVKNFKDKYFNNDKFKIGIKWKGNNAYDSNRIITIESFFKLFELPNTQFYSVQKDEGIEELEKIPPKYNIIDLNETLNDFTDTAAALENMDLIICNDTSVAHLAGAMRKPCWIMLPYLQNWRWHTDISYSPWYKSVKLFKQNEPGNWHEVFDRAYMELKNKYKL